MILLWAILRRTTILAVFLVLAYACKSHDNGGTSDGINLTPASATAGGSSAGSSVNGDCRTSGTGSAATVTATNVTGLKYFDIPYKPTSTASLNQVAIMISSPSCSTYTGTAGTMYLYSDSGGTPNTILGTGSSVSCSGIGTAASLVTFGFAGNTLTGATQYHLVFKIGGLTAGDTVTINEYATASGNCPGNKVSPILLLNGSWVNQTGTDVGILQIN